MEQYGRMPSSNVYADAFQNARAGLLLLEKPTGRVLEVNTAFLRIAGRRPDEVLGRNFWEPPLIADSAAGAELHDHLRKGGVVETADLPLLNAQDRLLLLKVSGTPAGHLIRVEVQDATGREQQRATERLDALRSMARRTAGEFQDLQRMLHTDARQAGEKAGHIAAQLLAFSGALKLQPRQISLNDLIQAMLPKLRQMLGHNIEIVCNLTPDLEPVWADLAQVVWIVSQLAANSLESMDRAGTFRIETRNTPAVEPGIDETRDDPYALLAISDSGPGFDDPSWTHLFEPFSSTRPNARGRGLGLAAVYGIVRQSGGRLWVNSQPEKGTTFHIYLPQFREYFPALPSAQPGTKRVDATILLVEPDAGLRSVLANILTRHGYRVLAANHAEEALRITDAHASPDLLIGQPDPELARRLMEVQPHLRVLLLDGGTNHPQTQGMAVLRKPFDPATLLSTVEELLERPL